MNQQNKKWDEQSQQQPTKTRKITKWAPKGDVATRALKTDQAMTQMRKALPSRVDQPQNGKKIRELRHKIEQTLTHLLQLDKQKKGGDPAALYLRVSSLAQATSDIETWFVEGGNIVEGSIVESKIVSPASQHPLTKEQLEEQARYEARLSKREQHTLEETEEHENSLKGSLKAQALQSFTRAQEQGYCVVAVIVDIHTGYELYEREGMNELRNRCKAGEISIVVGLCLDRVSRNMVHTLVLINEFKEFGITLDCVLQKIDTSLQGILLIAVNAWSNEDERERIIRRTTTGRHEKRDSGYLYGQGIPLYGYLWVKNAKGRNIARIHDPSTYKTIRWIGEQVMAGKSRNAICRELEDNGTPPPLKGHWQTTTITRLFRDAYRGKPTADHYKKERVKGKVRWGKNPDPYYYPNGALLSPPYWTEEECILIDAQFERNARDQKRNNRIACYEFLLRYPFARCGHCGSSMQSDVHQGKPVYRCRGKRVEGRSRAI